MSKDWEEVDEVAEAQEAEYLEQSAIADYEASKYETDSLDDILDAYGDNPQSYSTPDQRAKAAKVYLNNELAKSKIKVLMLELIGEDEAIYPDTLATDLKHERNIMKDIYRKKIEELFTTAA